MKKIVRHIPTQCCYYTEEDGKTVIICGAHLTPEIDGKIFWEYVDKFEEKKPQPPNPCYNQNVTRKMNLNWNTILYDGKKIRAYNIFNNYLFSGAIEKLFNMPEVSFQDFDTYVRRKAQWQFWSRCEYEMLLNAWPTGPVDSEYKIDVFEQLELNWDRFIEYLWNEYCFGGSENESE